MAGSILELRRKTVLQLLAETEGFVTVQQIADQVGVSRRTILREMDGVSEWLSTLGFSVLSKPGQGVVLEGGGTERSRLSGLLHGEQPEVVNMPKDRQKLILVELMQQKEPIKLYNITSRLGVSASTISNDLDKVEAWLENYDLHLVRKTGLGVYVEGKEADFRRAMIALLYENTSEEELMKIIKDTVPGRLHRTNLIQINVRNRLLNLIDRASIEKIENTVYSLEKRMSHRLAESACIGLMVHLALAIQRIKNNERITIDPVLLAELRRTDEFRFALEIGEEMSRSFSLEVPEDEVGYVTMHLKGARVYNDQAKMIESEPETLDRSELMELAREMIRVVESEFHMTLQEDDKLLLDLVGHLDPTLRRLEFNLDIRNPLLDKLKELFPEVYRISEKAAIVLKKRIGRDVPDAEIGFLAMHFGAAIEKRRGSFDKSIRVVVACPSGMGTSRLLSARLEKEFPDMEIVDVVSTFELSQDWLTENRISLVISTIPLEDCPIRTLCVNPLLMEDDRIAVQQAIRRATPRNPHDSAIPGLPLRENIAHVLGYSHFIADILEHHGTLMNDKLQTPEELAEALVREVTADPAEQAHLKEQILERAELMATGDCAVLNCTARSIPFHAFVLCRPRKELLSAFCRKPVHLLAVLVSPEGARNREETMIRDFSRYIGGNFRIGRSWKSLQPQDLDERLYVLLNDLYMSKLYDWRAGLHA